MHHSQSSRLATAKHTANRPAVGISIWGGAALLDSPVPEIAKSLAYSRTAFTAQGPEVVEQLLYSFDIRGRLAFPTGLVPTVVQQLDFLGYTVTVTDHREFGPEHRPSASVLERSAGEQRQLFAAVLENPIGQIQVPNQKQVVVWATQLYRLFPDARMVIAVATRKRARGLRWMLADALAEGVGLECGGGRRCQCRITVTTFGYLNAFDRRDVHILLLGDAAEAGGQVAKAMIGRMSAHAIRVYAFVHAGQKFSPADRLCIEAMAGQSIHQVKTSVAQVHAVVFPVQSSTHIKGTEGLERKRVAIWHNPKRNALIARVAKAFATRNVPSLRMLGMAITDEDGDWLKQIAALRIRVLVETTEHASELHKRLPNWSLLSRRPDSDAGQQLGVTAKPQNGIVTLTYATENPVNADVLILADGGNCPPVFKGFPPPARICPDGRVMLVDFQDSPDEQTRRHSRQRFREHAAKGKNRKDAKPTMPFPGNRTRQSNHNGDVDKLSANRPAVTDTPSTSLNEADAATPSANHRLELIQHISRESTVGKSPANRLIGCEALRDSWNTSQLADTCTTNISTNISRREDTTQISNPTAGDQPESIPASKGPISISHADRIA